jgi:hypothetical protein
MRSLLDFARGNNAEGVMRPLWRALALAWLGGVGSPALMDDCTHGEQAEIHGQINAASAQSARAAVDDEYADERHDGTKDRTRPDL